MLDPWAKCSRYVIFLKDHFIIYLIIHNLIINFKKIYNFFSLKIQKFWEKCSKSPNQKNFEGPLKLNEAFSSKTKVNFFHLILWTLKINNKKGKKNFIYFLLSAHLSSSWFFFVNLSEINLNILWASITLPLKKGYLHFRSQTHVVIMQNIFNLN